MWSCIKTHWDIYPKISQVDCGLIICYTMIYRLFVGSNNKTHKVEYVKADKIVASKVAGFTTYKSKGYWQGKAENSYIIELANVKNKDVLTIAELLRIGLKQQAVGVVKYNSKMRFI